MIEISGLTYRAGSNLILEDIDLQITDGEFVAIVGPNGAGKSTLIKLILGILQLQEGTILIDGVPHYNWLKRNSLGYLPQHEEFDRRFPATALDIVLLGLAGDLRLGQRFGAKHRQQGQAALQTTGVAELANKQIGSLSGGELQRVMLARAIVSPGKYLVLDEPEASVDQPGVQDFFAMLKQFNEFGKTIITISHDINMLTEYCSFLVCLNKHLHCHSKTEMVNSDTIRKTFGDALRLVDKHY